MNLAGMMKEVGIGCGEGCRCAKLFTATLDDNQKSIFAHMIEAGAKKRLKNIKKAGKRDGKSDQRLKSSRGPSLDGFMEQLFEDAFSPGREKNLSPFATMMRMVKRDEVEPYTGDLTADQIAVIAEANEDIRTEMEEALRKLIASRANNDPGRVTITTTDDGADVHYEVLADPENETRTGPADFMTMLKKVLRGRITEMTAEPYAGDLTANHIETLTTVDEVDRAKVEDEVRRAIAEFGDGDPRRVMIKSSKRGKRSIISATILDPIDNIVEDAEPAEKKTKAA